ncbi:DUF4179 domain-containing protein [Clostridium frigidicarnis]|uniref:DUF4179 domain-containing protein n=1 Tax=Clostridium frigidicarnis TaxID=84698 RepID=A0A1I0XDQ0_9CLOT|nr:DUF4179 domain-containing protein [Clostridium frigidicarnis]SFA98556.1 protein of unknown function [Clostridium frigidicarnis]
MSKDINNKLDHSFEDKDKKVRRLFEENNSTEDDFNLDEFFKKEFKNDDDLKVPSEIHNGLEEILLNLPQKKKSNKKRGALIAASVAGTLFITSLFTIPSFAESLPLVGDFFKVLHETSGQKNIVEEVEKNSKEVIGTAIDKNLEVNMYSVIGDSTGMTIAYSVESLDESVDLPQVWSCDIYIDGKQYDPDIDNIIHEEKDGLHYYITRLEIKDLPNKFNYKIDMKNITNVYGLWSFSGTADISNLQEDTIVKDINETKNTIIGEVTVKSVIKTPLYIQIQCKYPEQSLRESNEDDNDNRYYKTFRLKYDRFDKHRDSIFIRGSEDGDRRILIANFDKNVKYIDFVAEEYFTGEANVKEINIKDSIDKVVYDEKDGSIKILDYKEEGNKKLVRVKLDKKLVRVKLDKKVRNGLYNLAYRLVCGERVNKYGDIINGRVAGVPKESFDKNEYELWLEYEGDKFFINGDRTGEYSKFDENNKIRIDLTR